MSNNEQIYGCLFANNGFSFKLHKLGALSNGELMDMWGPDSHLSDFHAYALKLLGDSMMGDEAQSFWLDGKYIWFTDSTQQQTECLYQTENGVLMFITGDELYRVFID